MEHRPITEYPGRNVFGDTQRHFKMPVIPLDAIAGGLNNRLGPFQQLQVNILPTDKRSRDIVPRIAPPCVQQYAVQQCTVIAERP